MEDLAKSRKEAFEEISHLLDRHFTPTARIHEETNVVDVILEIYGIRVWKVSNPDTAKSEQVAA